MASPHTEPDIMSAEAFSVAELREIVFGRSQRLAKPLAIALLGRKQYPEKIADLERVLLDRAETPQAVHMAAIELGRIQSGKAISALRRGLKSNNPLVLQGVLWSLGQVGGQNELAAVEKLFDRTEIRAAAGWAATLIAYRTGKPDFVTQLPERPRLLPVNSAQAVEIAHAPGGNEEALQATREAALSAAGTQLVAERALRLECPGKSLLFLASKTLTARELSDELGTTKTIAGIVAAKPLTSWESKYLVLTEPARSQRIIQIRITSLNGEVVFAGEGLLQGRELQFEIRSVERPGAVPVELRGFLMPDEIRLNTALVERRKLPDLVPRGR